MNAEQVKGLIRQILPLVGGIASALGYASPGEVTELTEKVLAAVGPVLILSSAVWSYMSKTDKAIVQKGLQAAKPAELTAKVVALLDEKGNTLVQSVTTAPTTAGEILANAVPDPRVRAAGFMDV